MRAVKISSRFQVVIPKRVRESMHLRPGQQVQVVAFSNRIELVPLKKIITMRGFVRGIGSEKNERKK